MIRCPASAELQELLSDELAGPLANTIEAHVETCSDCQQVLERLTLDTGRRARHALDFAEESTIAFLRDLERQPPTGAWPSSEQTSLTAKEPAPAPQGDQARPEVAPQLAVARLVDRTLPKATDIQVLLRKRLLFVSVVSWAAFAVYLATVFVLVAELPVIALYALMLAFCGGLAAMLWSSRPLSLRQLRWIELALFGGSGLFFTEVQCQLFASGWLLTVDEHGWLGAFLLARALSFNWSVMMVLYGTLIPNTWRRCAVVVGLIAVWPVLLNASAGLWAPRADGRLMAIFVVESGFNMLVVAALAVYGSYRIEVLRQIASQSRKLGQYQLTKRLGGGGMGEVYLAEHMLLRRPCAIKLIRAERAGEASNLLRFEREVQATARLTHPNTVEILDYGHAEDGTFYYVMEYLPGLNLEQLVKRHGRLVPERVVHLLRQLCGALREAHATRLIHRDIKPSNVLVCERGGRHDVVKLLDFGLVQDHVLDEAEQRLTVEGVIAGTPDYMSPEQAAGKADLDCRSDIYSLGGLAYFLLSGRPPFVRPTTIQTLAAHIYETPEVLERSGIDVPPDLAAVILCCLEKDPARRFPSAESLDEALARCDCSGRWTDERAAAWWSARGAVQPQDAAEHDLADQTMLTSRCRPLESALRNIRPNP